MKYQIHLSKIANQFFFIANLTNWHFLCRNDYNKKWLEKTGSLSPNEERALMLLTRILKKYGFIKDKQGNSLYLGIPFISQPDNIVWKAVQDWVTPQDHQSLKYIFDVFQKRFDKTWDKKRIKATISQLENKIIFSQKELAKEVIKILEILFNSRINTNEHLDIHLLLAPPGVLNTGGGAYLGPHKIALEISDVDQRSINWINKILLQKIIHASFEKKYFLPLVNKFASQQDKTGFMDLQTVKEMGSLPAVLTEMITSSLAPEGYLDEFIFKQDVKQLLNKRLKIIKSAHENPLVELRVYAALQLYPEVKKYIAQEQSIDNQLLDKAYKYLKEFENTIS